MRAAGRVRVCALHSLVDDYIGPPFRGIQSRFSRGVGFRRAVPDSKLTSALSIENLGWAYSRSVFECSVPQPQLGSAIRGMI